MSDILEKSLERLRDRSGAPSIEDPEAFVNAVMKAVEEPVAAHHTTGLSRELWPLVLRACIGAAAAVLFIVLIGIESQPKVPQTASECGSVVEYEFSAQNLLKNIEIAKRYTALKDVTL